MPLQAVPALRRKERKGKAVEIEGEEGEGEGEVVWKRDLNLVVGRRRALSTGPPPRAYVL